MIELFVAILNRSVKDLDSDSADLRAQSLDYFLLDNEAFIKSCKDFAIDSDFISEEVKKIAEEKGFRRKKLVENLIIKIREYL